MENRPTVRCIERKLQNVVTDSWVGNDDGALDSERCDRKVGLISVEFSKDDQNWEKNAQISSPENEGGVWPPSNSHQITG